MEQSKFYQIKNITEHEYTLVGCDGSVITRPIRDIDKSASVFTIQDAKDGDILVSVTDKPFIYNGWFNDISVGAYGGIDVNNDFVAAENEYSWTMNKDIRPATKEQSDLLSQKLMEAGYGIG